MSQAAPWEVQIGYQEKFLHRKSGQALEQAAQRGGGVTIPGVFKKYVDMALQGTVQEAWWCWVDSWT